MNNIIIRDVRIEDVHEMSVVRKKVWNTTYRGIYSDQAIDNFDYERAKERFKSYIDRPNTLFKVALHNNKIIGYICFSKDDKLYKDYEYVIKYLHILKDYQGKGLGTTLFKEVLNYAKRNNIKKFYLSCNKYNYQAQRFYEKMGGKKDHIDKELDDRAKEQIIYIYRIGVSGNDWY